jgi:hypothetical protein
VLVSTLAVALSSLWRRLPIDDAYITFRYALNVAAGHGLVFNVGESVLGTTTPLWALILAGVSKLGLDIESSAVIAGGVCTIASIVLFLVAIPVAATLRLKVVWAILIALYYPLSAVTFSGMETPLYILVVGLGLYSFTTQRFVLGALLGFVATLIRPDGFLVVVAGLLGSQRRSRTSAIVAILVYGAALAPCALWAYEMYGSALPHSVEAKRILYHTGPFKNMLFFFEALSQEPVDALVLCMGGAGILLLMRDALMRPFVVWALLYSVGIIFSGVKPIFYWYFGPLWFVLLTIGFEGIRRGFTGKVPPFIPTVCALVLFVVLAVDVRKRAPGFDPVEVRENAYRAISERYRNSIAPGDKVVMSEIGVLGYGLPNATVIDSLGLVSPHVSDIIRQSGLVDLNLMPMKGTPWLREILDRDNPTWLIGAKDLTITDAMEKESWFSERYQRMEVVAPEYFGGVVVFKRR